MGIAVQPYDVKKFNSLLDFGDVGPTFDSLGGENIVASKMKPMFRRHGVEHDLGVVLLHQHFQLGQGEQLTDVRGTSVPLSFETTPCIWALQGGEQRHLRPMEFTIENRKAPMWDQPQFQTFLEDFAQLLEECGGQNIFGLCSYPGDEFPGRVEFTSGRANVNLTPQEAQKFLTGKTREAAWYFSTELMDEGCKCLCVEDDRGSHSHGRHVYTT